MTCDSDVYVCFLWDLIFESVVQSIFFFREAAGEYRRVKRCENSLYIFDLSSLGYILCMSFDDHSTSSRGCIRGLIGSIELAA